MPQDLKKGGFGEVPVIGVFLDLMAPCPEVDEKFLPEIYGQGFFENVSENFSVLFRKKIQN
jgi:hypothetical protein